MRSQCRCTIGDVVSNESEATCAEETSRHVARINQYLDDKNSIRFASIEGTSFLRYAILMSDENLAIRIIEKGIDVDINEPWDDGQSPLHVACQSNMVKLIEAIFKHKAKALDLHAITDDCLLAHNKFRSGGKTILHYAAINGALEACKLIIEFEKNAPSPNALLSIRDFEDDTAIDSAVIHKNYKVAQYLLSLGSKTKFENDEWIKIRQGKCFESQQTKEVITRLRIQNWVEISKNEELNQAFTLKKLWNEDVCKYVLDKVIKFGDANGWTTKRHRTHGTVDIPSHCVGHELDDYVRKLLRQTLYPVIIQKYALNELLGADATKGEFVEIKHRDLFFVKYDMLKQRELKLHRDGSMVSFNILLNDSSEFEGGGTFFDKTGKVIEIDRGDCVIHSGRVLHAGHPITKGKRYILVGFLDGRVRKKANAFCEDQ